MSTKMFASFRVRAIDVCTFWKLSYESQCTSSVWTEWSKCCVVMLRFRCLYITWALSFEMKNPCTPKQSIRAIIGGVHQLGRTKARAESVLLHALTSRALSRTHFHMPLHRAHWRRAHVAHTWPYKFAQIELNIRVHSQLMSVGHFDFQNFLPPLPPNGNISKKCPLGK